MNAFHLAFPVRDIAATRRFYVDVLGCVQGRETDRWIDFDFFGHQISAHVAPEACDSKETSEVDGVQVPLRHFGLILDWKAWEALAARLYAQGVAFVIEPTIRYPGKPGEQGTFFILDPSGNGVEFKAFRNPDEVFAKQA